MEAKSKILDVLYFERSIFEQFMEYTRRFSKFEWGGLLIGTEVDGKLYCVAAVIPPQKTQSMGYCEFKKELFSAIYNCFEKIEEKYSTNEFTIITWIHTHPNLGVFLSGTDVETYEYLVKLNPNWSAIVVDPVKRDFLAVNSRPGNLYGFSPLELNLHYLHNFADPDQSLIEKLNLLKNNLNSKINKKILNLNESESVELFIPVPLQQLKHEILQSRLDGLISQVQTVKESLFHSIPSNSIDKKATSTDLEKKIPDGKDPELAKIVNYISGFQRVESEINGWTKIPLNKQLFNFDIGLLPESQAHIAYRTLKGLYEFFYIIGAFPVTRYSLTDHFLHYANDYKSIPVRWGSIKKCNIDILENFKGFIIITYKTGFFSRKKQLLLVIPQAFQERMTQIFESKVKLTYDRTKEVAKVLKFIKVQQEERKRLQAEKKEKAELSEKSDTKSEGEGATAELKLEDSPKKVESDVEAKPEENQKKEPEAKNDSSKTTNSDQHYT